MNVDRNSKVPFKNETERNSAPIDEQFKHTDTELKLQ